MVRRAFRIDYLEVADHILDKIEVKHGVTLVEAEDACLSGPRHVMKVREGRYLVLGQTGVGRYLASVVARRRGFEFALLSARDMASHERRLYARHKK